MNASLYIVCAWKSIILKRSNEEESKIQPLEYFIEGGKDQTNKKPTNPEPATKHTNYLKKIFARHSCIISKYADITTMK